MTETTTTLFSDKCQILGELWINYKTEEEFEDFITYNDLGLPLAYALANNIVKQSEMAKAFVEETFDLFLASLELEDTGWDSLDDMLSMAKGF